MYKLVGWHCPKCGYVISNPDCIHWKRPKKADGIYEEPFSLPHCNYHQVPTEPKFVEERRCGGMADAPA